ncbi:Malate synthase G [Aminobacter sp. MSH1]|nr:Malate synthase G [Aminobacter sp. MSH1]
MAAVVDRQNGETEGYKPRAPGFDSPVFKAAEDPAFIGRTQPSGWSAFESWLP